MKKLCSDPHTMHWHRPAFEEPCDAVFIHSEARGAALSISSISRLLIFRLAPALTPFMRLCTLRNWLSSECRHASACFNPVRLSAREVTCSCTVSSKDSPIIVASLLNHSYRRTLEQFRWSGWQMFPRQSVDGMPDGSLMNPKALRQTGERLPLAIGQQFIAASGNQS